MDALDVHLNRDGPHAIDVASTLSVTGPFEIVLTNHGRSLHVHLNLDADLARAASLGSANHYVDEEAVRRVRVGVREDRLPVEGRLKIVTGYGSETEYVTLSIDREDEERTQVQVDERLARPQPRTEEGPLLVPDALPVVALGAVALFVALLVAVVIGDVLVIAGVLIVVIGIVAAASLLRT